MTSKTSVERTVGNGRTASGAVDIAARLAVEFRQTTAELDRTGEFPSANYDRMRADGYLRALVPTELGGFGAGILEMSHAQQALARGCASTALAVNMHQFQVGFMADGWRKTQAPGVEKALRRVAEEGIVLASTGAEAIVPGIWTTPTTAQRDGEGYRITGRKYFCSQAPGMDLVRVMARDVDTDELLILGVPAGAEGVSVVETWDTSGMRATASHDVVFDNVYISEAAVGARLPAGEPMRTAPMAGVATWFLSLVSGVYLGIAEEARAEAYKAIGTGINSSYRDDALTNVLVGQMEADFMAARAVRDDVVGRLDRDRSDPQATLADVVLLKEIVTDKAISIVDRAVQLAGGRGYFRKSPLERLARDVRAGRFHPPSSPQSFQLAGQRLREATPASVKS